MQKFGPRNFTLDQTPANITANGMTKLCEVRVDCEGAAMLRMQMTPQVTPSGASPDPSLNPPLMVYPDFVWAGGPPTRQATTNSNEEQPPTVRFGLKLHYENQKQAQWRFQDLNGVGFWQGIIYAHRVEIFASTLYANGFDMRFSASISKLNPPGGIGSPAKFIIGDVTGWPVASVQATMFRKPPGRHCMVGGLEHGKYGRGFYIMPAAAKVTIGSTAATANFTPFSWIPVPPMMSEIRIVPTAGAIANDVATVAWLATESGT